MKAYGKNRYKKNMKPITALTVVLVAGFAQGENLIKNYEEQLNLIMNEDVLDDDMHKRSVEEQSEPGSGDDSQDKNDLRSSPLTPAEIMAIVVCSIVGIAIIVFVTSCCWYKMKNPRRSLVPLYNDEDTESMLYMIDYDDVNLQHGRLHIQITKTSASNKILN